MATFEAATFGNGTVNSRCLKLISICMRWVGFIRVEVIRRLRMHTPVRSTIPHHLVATTRSILLVTDFRLLPSHSFSTSRHSPRMVNTHTSLALAAALFSFVPAVFGKEEFQKIYPCVVPAGPNGGCSRCSEERGLETAHWQSAWKSPNFDFPDAQAQKGSGWDVYWVSRAPHSSFAAGLSD